MRSMLLAIVAIAGGLLHAQQVLYCATGSDGVNSQLYRVNPATAASTLIGSVTVGGAAVALTGMAAHPANGELYAVTANSSTNHARSLLKVNPVDATATLVGSLGANPVPDISFNAAGTLFGWSAGQGAGAIHDLVAIELANGQVTPVGDAGVGASTGSGLSISLAGVCYLSRIGADGALEIVNMTTGALTTGPTMTGAPWQESIVAMSFTLAAELYAVNSVSPASPAMCNLVRIDYGTGAVTDIGVLPLDTDALAFSKDGPEMHMYRNTSQIANGGSYTFNAPRGVIGPLDFWIMNLGGANLTLTTPVTISGHVNCTATPATNPISPVQLGKETKAVITLGTPTLGPYSFTVTIQNNDADEGPYSFTVSGNVFEIGGSEDPTAKKDDSGCAAGPAPVLAVLLPALLPALRRRRARPARAVPAA